MQSLLSTIIGVSLLFTSNTTTLKPIVPEFDLSIVKIVDVKRPNNGFDIISKYDKPFLSEDDKKNLKYFIDNPSIDVTAIDKVIAKYQKQIADSRLLFASTYYQDHAFADKSLLGRVAKASPVNFNAVEDLYVISSANILNDFRLGKVQLSINDIFTSLKFNNLLFAGQNNNLYDASLLVLNKYQLPVVNYMLDSGKLNKSKLVHVINELSKVNFSLNKIFISMGVDILSSFEYDRETLNKYLNDVSVAASSNVCSQALYDSLSEQRRSTLSVELAALKNDVVLKNAKSICAYNDRISLLIVKSGILLAKKSNTKISDSLLELQALGVKVSKSNFDNTSLKYSSVKNIIYSVGTDLRDSGGSSKLDGTDDLEITYIIK